MTATTYLLPLATADDAAPRGPLLWAPWSKPTRAKTRSFIVVVAASLRPRRPDHTVQQMLRWLSLTGATSARRGPAAMVGADLLVDAGELPPHEPNELSVRKDLGGVL